VFVVIVKSVCVRDGVIWQRREEEVNGRQREEEVESRGVRREVWSERMFVG